MDVGKDLKTLLTGITTSIYLYDVPEKPDNIIHIDLAENQPYSPQYTLGGPKTPAFQKIRMDLVVRHTSTETALNWIESIQDALETANPQTINGHYYLSMMQFGEVENLGKDEKHRAIFAVYFDITVTR